MRSYAAPSTPYHGALDRRYTPPTMEAYPIGPILDRWREDNDPHQHKGCGCTIGGACASTESLARRVGVSHSTMHRRMTIGHLTYDEADRWACLIGAMPYDIWPAWGRTLLEPEPECTP